MALSQLSPDSGANPANPANPADGLHFPEAGGLGREAPATEPSANTDAEGTCRA